MPKKEKNIAKKRLRTSYMVSVISIALVLFMLGIFGLLFLNAKKISEYVKENIGFTIFIKDQVKEVDVIRLQKKLETYDYVRQTQYISKERAAEIMKEELGEDFIEFLGYNPLSASIDIKLKAQYANKDSIAKIENDLRNYEEINEIYFQESLVNKINENIKKIGLGILLFCLLLLLIAITLINNTVRLSIYSKRFIINTMQLVGASRSFIRKPFVLRSILHGIYASLLSVLLLCSLVYLIQKEFIEIISFNDIEILGILFIFVTIFGVIISYLSTYFSVNKFLRLSTNDLYFYQ
jgi:cell division transport system permease protein